MALIRAVIGYESRKMCLIVYRGFDRSIIRSAQLQNNAVPTPVLSYVMSIYAIFCQLFQLFSMMMMMMMMMIIIIIIILGRHSNLSISRFVRDGAARETGSAVELAAARKEDKLLFQH